MGELRVNAIPAHQLESIARWIHSDLPAQELLTLLDGLSESNQRQVLQPGLEIVLEELASDGSRLAAAYFLRLPGRVATLGGVRALAGKNDLGAELIQKLICEFCTDVDGGCSQIQAIVASSDYATQDIVRRAGFEHLTNVQHMWLNPMNGSPPPQSNPAIGWLPAQNLARRRMAQTLAKTFEYTLDCPAINGLRNDEEVLSGFLNGQPFREMKHWELLEVDGKLGGCLLLHCHSESLVELVYMGIQPELRGAALGARLVSRAIEVSQARGSTMLVVAVDEQNWPAQQLYLRSGFIPHAKLGVWLAT